MFMYSYCYVYVFLLYVYVFLLYVYVFLLLCMVCSLFSVSLCCFVYRLCVTVHRTTDTWFQPNCSYQIYLYLYTLFAGLLASSQYPEGPATGHLGTGFACFPCVCL